MRANEVIARDRLLASNDPYSPWGIANGWRLNGAGARALLFADPLPNLTREIRVRRNVNGYAIEIDERSYAVSAQDENGKELKLTIDGNVSSALVLRHKDHYLVDMNGERYEFIAARPFAFEHAEESTSGRLTALMPGRIVKVMVSTGDIVANGQPLLIMEAMKMEHTIHSPREGKIEKVFYKVDEIVAADAPLFAFELT